MEMLKTSVSKTQFQMIKEIGYQNERLKIWSNLEIIKALPD
jgi:hypothetical protein